MPAGVAVPAAPARGVRRDGRPASSASRRTEPPRAQISSRSSERPRSTWSWIRSPSSPRRTPFDVEAVPHLVLVSPAGSFEEIFSGWSKAKMEALGSRLAARGTLAAGPRRAAGRSRARLPVGLTGPQPALTGPVRPQSPGALSRKLQQGSLMTDRPTTLGELVAAGYAPKTVKDEIRDNLIAKLKAGENVFPGILGYEKTVVPALQNAILARHDIILLGLRGQAKTRILRALVNLLDEEIPVIAGSELNESPFAPFTAYGRRMAASRRGRPARRVARARRALPREARDAGRHDRRPHRRRRPREGRDAPQDVRGRGRHPLRHRPAHEPRHLRDQRAARPAAAHPGRPPEHPRGARPPDPRLPAAHPARRPHGLLARTPRTTRTAATSSRR